jgi:hypothetical protein
MRAVASTEPKRLARLVENGRYKDLSYIIMEQYGPTLKQMNMKSIYGRFSYKTSV